MSDLELHEPEVDGGDEEGSESVAHRGVEDLIGLLGERLNDGKSDGIDQCARLLATEMRHGTALTSDEAEWLEALLATPGANAIPTSLWLDLDRALRAR